MDKFTEHQRRLWQQMLQVISDYRAGKVTFCAMVGNLEGALDAGDFKDAGIREQWYDVWTPLEIARATGDTNGQDVDQYISKMQTYLEATLAAD